MVVKEKNLYCFTIALLLMFGTLLCLGESIGIKEGEIEKSAYVYYLAGCAVVGIVAAWFQLARKGRMILAAAIVLSVGIMMRDEALWQETVRDYIPVILIGLFCCAFSLLIEKIKGIGALSACIVLGFLGVDLLGERNLPHMGVVCALLYVAMIYVEWNESRWQKERLANSRYYMVRILPFWILYFVLMTVMPAQEEPYDWQFVKDVYRNVREVVLQISRNWIDADREDFAFGTSGFRDNSGRIGGNISDSGRSVMVIQGQKSLKTNVYLTGKVYNTFDGVGWTSTDESDINDRQLDAFETLYAVNCLDESGASNYIERTRLSIWYDDFRTGCLFTPLKTIKLQNMEDDDFKSVGGNYLFHDKQGYGLTYNTFFFQLNVDHPLVYDMLASVSEEGFEDKEAVLKEIQKDYFIRTKYKLTDLDNHRENIYQNYNQPVELSEEVRMLLAEVTQDAKNDVEKLRAIENMLQQMVYTKTPGELPGWVDSESAFLDYFLLESRQGYCVYYATAFVLLARAEGIPARYAEGFCVPVKGIDKVVVTSDMAHAWPEVYVDHVGWIPFEPTPGYEAIRYTPWEIRTEGVQGDGVGISADTESDWEAEEDESEDWVNQEPEEVSEKEEVSEVSGSLWKIAGLTVVFIIIGSIMVLWVEWLLRRRRVKQCGLKERFLLEVLANMRMLAALGYERRDNETLSELRARAWAIMDGEEADNKPEFLFLDFYEEYLYGEYAVNQEMLDTVLSEKRCLLLMLKRWKGIWYLYYKLYYDFS